MLKPLPDHLLHKNIECIEADPFNNPDLYMAVMQHNKQPIPAWWYRWYNSRIAEQQPQQQVEQV